MIRTVIADDNKLFRKALRKFLDSESIFEIIAEVKSGVEAVAMAEEETPDLVLMDIRMPGGNGLSAIRTIKKTKPNIKVVVLTLYDEKQLDAEAAKSGADAYVLKKDLYGSLIPIIQRLFPDNNYEK